MSGAPWSGPVPSPVPQGSAVGHLIRDAASLVIADYPGLTGLRQLLAKYAEESAEKANVGLMIDVEEGGGGEAWGVVATRDLPPGSELLWRSYPQHWLSSLMQSHEDPLVRLLLYIYNTDVSPHLFPAGYLLEEEERGRLVHSKNGRPLTEAYCLEFCNGFLGLKGRWDETYGRFGVDPTLSCRQKLMKMWRVVTTETPVAAPAAAAAEGKGPTGEGLMGEGEGVSAQQ